MKFQKTTQVKLTNEFVASLRRNEMPVEKKDSQKVFQSKKQFHETGKLSFEVFEKTKEEKKMLKKLKSTCNNKQFQKITRLKNIGNQIARQNSQTHPVS